MRIPPAPQFTLAFSDFIRYSFLVYIPASIDPRGGHNRAQINSAFFQNWSPNMAYALGYIFADGAIEDVQASSRTCYFAISSKDLSILESIRATLDSNHTIYVRSAGYTNFPNNRRYFSREIFSLRIGNKAMYNDLLKLGVTPRKSLDARFPRIPEEYLSFFVRGYFDGDGCLHLVKGKYPRLVFTSGSLEFLERLAEQLAWILGNQKKRVSTSRQGNPSCYQLSYNTQLSVPILRYMYQNLESAPYLVRKHQIYLHYLQMI